MFPYWFNVLASKQGKLDVMGREHATCSPSVGTGGFDFIYMPQSQWTSKPVGLVFINFESPAHAKQGIIHLRGLSVRAHWERIEVKEAEIQGLLPNLAYFVARFGLDAVRNEDAPQVFQ
ncbi:unnamed protein product, partial [Effrenium voratum]